MGSIHSASLETSKRLQRVFAVLSDGRPHTTLDIISAARVCAVNSCVSEIRTNGYNVRCEHKGVGLFEYTLVP